MYQNLIRIIYLQDSKVQNIRTYASGADICLTKAKGITSPYFVKGKITADVLEDVIEDVPEPT